MASNILPYPVTKNFLIPSLNKCRTVVIEVTSSDEYGWPSSAKAFERDLSNNRLFPIDIDSFELLGRINDFVNDYRFSLGIDDIDRGTDILGITFKSITIDFMDGPVIGHIDD